MKFQPTADYWLGVKENMEKMKIIPCKCLHCEEVKEDKQQNHWDNSK